MNNLYIGGAADQYSKYLGHFAEFVYFDHKVPDVVRENIQKHLDRKYGRSKKNDNMFNAASCRFTRWL